MALDIKRITNDGRIQIPKKWINEMDIKKNEYLLLYYDENAKVIKINKMCIKE